MSHQHFSVPLFLASLLVLVSMVSTTSISGNSDILGSSDLHWTSAHVKTFEGETYHIVYEPKLNWSEAVTSCANAGLVLTSIETVEQFEFLKSVANITNAELPWIGASRPPSGGDFTWVATGQVVLSFIWPPTEPNNSGGKEYYVQIRVDGANDKFETPFAYICTTKTGFPPTTEQPPEPTTEQESTSGTTTTRRPGPGICTEPGIIPDPFDCTKFHDCQYNEVGDIWDYVFECPATTVWCQGSLNCESPDFCPCEL